MNLKSITRKKVLNFGCVLAFFVTVGATQAVYARDFEITKDANLKVSYPESSRPILKTSIDMLNGDLNDVFGNGIDIVNTDASLRIVIDPVAVKDEQGFSMSVNHSGELVIIGHDSHGAAYGVVELSRLIGVSPWEWWTDATPAKKKSFSLPEGFSLDCSPSVKYRGIFINDEDWGLMPWSSKNYEPSDIAGHIGPKTNAKIFELMLRLRANAYWPAMHECSVPFFLIDGNREIADKYGIYIGGSHCEPMACSTAGEWPRRGKGDYDYVSNSASVYKFWEKRAKEVAGQEILYTIGMRGVHDGAMNGAKTVEEQKAVLERVICDQRRLLADNVNADVTKVPQVFIPYKEVLDIYNAGLDVPEDVTLMWCDDNYGYIRHFPTEMERNRKGGNGIYYHVSYWGRPHDYLWLGTFSPYLLYQQMKLAYDKGIKDIWILNVGDIKPAEYQIELFMDMAWDMNKVNKEGVSVHLENFLCREFGEKTGKKLLPVMDEYYRLAYIRKPEFMGNTREEERDRIYRIVKDLPWSAPYILQRLADYQNISDRAEKLAAQIPSEREDTYFQLVKYPVQASTEMNKKMLYAQLARHGEMDWSKSDAAYDSIVALTQIYNAGIKNNGKWNRIMDYQPRCLPVFKPVDHSVTMEPMKEERMAIGRWNAAECAKGDFVPCEGLGYEGKAALIPKGKSVTFELPDCPSDSVEVEVCLLPSHPVEGTQLRFTIALGKEETSPIHYETKGRSEEWKENVLRNQAIRRMTLPIQKRETNKLVIKALDEGVVLDQVTVYPL